MMGDGREGIKVFRVNCGVMGQDPPKIETETVMLEHGRFLTKEAALKDLVGQCESYRDHLRQKADIAQKQFEAAESAQASHLGLKTEEEAE